MYAIKIVTALALLFSASPVSASYHCNDNTWQTIPDKSEAKSKIAQACQSHLQGTYKPNQWWTWCYTDSHSGYYYMSIHNGDRSKSQVLYDDSCVAWLDAMADDCSRGGANTPAGSWEADLYWISGPQPAQCNSV